MATAKDSLSPDFIAQIKGLDIKARLVVEGFLTGLHKSPYHGFSVEFAEYRSYMPGDEIKRIDWKALARSDRYYVKEFEEETNLKAYLLLDSSASMGYHTRGGGSKYHYGSCLAAALSLLLLNQHDAAGLATFREGISNFMAPSSRRSHWRQMLELLDKEIPAGKTDFERIFYDLAGHLKRRGLIIMISDLWDGSNAVLKALKHFRHLKHEVLLFHLLDHDELALPFSGKLAFEDMETGERIQLDAASAAPEYRRAVASWREGLSRECRRDLIDYIPLDTKTPFDKALLSYLHKRQRLG
ncbi:MAG: DUF58 domain-containing protein [Candidatus Edwardsbacteria bacterium]|nr:DUF58 domain-containing protein [Candidatus Edwardsbacteria bacterium]